MKKTTQRLINKNALKAIPVLMAAGIVGYRAFSKHQDHLAKVSQINSFKEELINYEEKVKTNDQSPVTLEVNQNSSCITISDKVPEIAIIYHDNGEVSIFYHNTLLSLTAASEQYPELTANIRQYITETHGEINTLKNFQSTTIER